MCVECVIYRVYIRYKINVRYLFYPRRRTTAFEKLCVSSYTHLIHDHMLNEP